MYYSFGLHPHWARSHGMKHGVNIYLKLALFDKKLHQMLTIEFEYKPAQKNWEIFLARQSCVNTVTLIFPKRLSYETRSRRRL